jgi:adhesin transport system outer membrane protein
MKDPQDRVIQIHTAAQSQLLKFSAGKSFNSVNIRNLKKLLFLIFPFILTGCLQTTKDIGSISENITAIISEAKVTEHSQEQIELHDQSDFSKAIREAVLKNNSALAFERSMQSKIEVAESTQRIQINGSSTIGGIREDGGNTADQTTTGIAAGITLSQLIYDGGQSASNISRATAEAFGASAERRSIGNDIALEAGRAWIDYWQYQTRLFALQERTSEMNNIVSQMERMASNGMIDRAALDSARRQILDISLEEMLYKSELEQAQINFIRFFNYDLKSVSKPSEIDGLAEALGQSDNWRRSPSLQKTAAEVVVATHVVQSAQAAFEPRAKVQGGLTSPMKNGESTDTSLGVVLEYTFGDGGKRAAQLKEAKAGLEAAKSRLQDVQTGLDAELKSAMNKLNALKKSMPLIQEKILLSKDEAKTARSQLTTGQADLRKLIDAKLENYRAEDRLISMQAEKLTLELLIAAKSGALSELIGLENS